MARTAEIHPLERGRQEKVRSPTFDVAPPHHAASDMLTPLDVFGPLWRRKTRFIGAVVSVTLFSLLAANLITSKYSASVLLVMGGETAEALTFTYVWPKRARAQILRELEIMQSSRLIEMTVDRLDLRNDPEFNRSRLARWGDRLSKVSLLKPMIEYFRTVGANEPTPAEAAARNRQVAVDVLRSNLDVQPPRFPNIVTVTVKSVDPKKAARIANTLVEIYMADSVDRRDRAKAETIGWRDDRIAELRQALLDSERAVAEFLVSRHLVETGEDAIIERQLAEVYSQLSAAKAQLAEKKTRLTQVLRLRHSDRGLGSVKEVRSSPVIRHLRDQEAALLRQVAELEPNYGERHPKMMSLRAKLAAARREIEGEQQRIVEELENEVRIAQARVSAVTSELVKLDSERLAGGQDAVRLRQLKRAVETNQRLYEAHQFRLMETGSLGDSADDEGAQIISSALAPVHPNYPRKGLIVGVGFVVSLGVGCFLVFLSERLDMGASDIVQLQNMTGMPVLGSVPRLAVAEEDGRATVEVVSTSPDSNYGEAIRSIWTGLTVRKTGHSPKVVLVASALRGEGKTSLAVSLARHAARSTVRRNVVLVDCDLRRPAVSGVMGLRADVGLAQLFAGEASMDAVLKIDPKSGLHVLPATPGTPNPPDLLHSRHMRDLLDELTNSYDLVVMDSTAVDTASDALVLAHLADATVFVVEYRATPRKKVIGSLKLLVHAGARIAGLVLQKANDREFERDAYSGRTFLRASRAAMRRVFSRDRLSRTSAPVS